jgi:hypothetical protein
LIKIKTFASFSRVIFPWIAFALAWGYNVSKNYGQSLPLHESPFLVQVKSLGAIPNYYDAASDIHGNIWVSSDNGLYLTNGDELVYANISDKLSTKDIWGIDFIHGYLYATGFTKHLNLILSSIHSDQILKRALPDAIETVNEKPSAIGSFIWFPIPYGGMLQSIPYGSHKIYKTSLGIKNPVQYCGQWQKRLYFWNGYCLIGFDLEKNVLSYYSIWTFEDFLSHPKFSPSRKWLMVQKVATAKGTKIISFKENKVFQIPFASATHLSEDTKVRIIPSNDHYVWLELNNQLAKMNEDFSIEVWPIDAQNIQRIATTPNNSRLLICGKAGIYILPFHIIHSKPIISEMRFEDHGFIANDPNHLWATSHDSLYILDTNIRVVKAWKTSFSPRGLIKQGEAYHAWGQDYQLFSNSNESTYVYGKGTGDGIVDTLHHEQILFKNLAIKKCFLFKNLFFYFNNFSVGAVEFQPKQIIIKTISSTKLLDLVHFNQKKIIAIYPNRITLIDFNPQNPRTIFSHSVYAEGLSTAQNLKDGTIEGNYKSSFFVLKQNKFYTFPQIQIVSNSNNRQAGFFRTGADIFLRTAGKPIFLPQSIIYHPSIKGNPIVIHQHLYLRNRQGSLLKIKFEPVLNTPIRISKLYAEGCHQQPDGSFLMDEKGSPFQIKIGDDVYPSTRNSRFKIQINQGLPFYSNNFTLNISYLPPRHSAILIEPISNMASKTTIQIYRAPKWHESYFTYFLVFVLSIGSVAYLIWHTQKKAKQRLKLITQLKELDNIAFKARFNPHFLFNSLNSLQLLIEIEDYRKASNYITKLSVLFRNFLKSTNLKFHSLSDEINLLKSYAELQQLKYNNLFTVEFHLPKNENLFTWAVPTGVIQPLIENAIKHGIGISPEPNGKIYIVITKSTSDEAEISIIDNGPCRDDNQSSSIKDSSFNEGTGTGLKMIGDRLAVLKDAYQYPCTLSAKKTITFKNQSCTKYTINFNPNSSWLKS